MKTRLLKLIRCVAPAHLPLDINPRSAMTSLAVALLLALVPRPATAATRNFIVPSGNWDRSTHWSPSGVPTGIDDALIEHNRAALVPAGVSGSARTINVGATGRGELNIFGGSISGSTCVFGSKPGAHGQLNISAGSFLTRNLLIGSAGPAEMNLSGGLVDGFNAVVSGGVGTSGTVIMTGGQWHTSSDLTIDGSLRLVTGTLQANGNSLMGESAGSSALAIVQGGQWSTNHLIVGGSGSGQLEVRGGVVSGMETRIGGFSGSVLVAGGTLATSLRMGTQGPATLDLTGGIIFGSYGVIGSSGTTPAVATISNGHWTVDSLMVGAQGHGILNLTDQGVLTIQSGTGTLLLGAEAGSTGTLNLGTGEIGGELLAAEVSGSLGQGTVCFNTRDSYTFAPRIAGPVAVKKTGTSTAILEAANSYTGPTTVEGGRLAMGVNGSINRSNHLTISSGAIFDATAVAGGRLNLSASQKVTVGLPKSGSAGRLEAQVLDIRAGTLEFAFAEQPNEPVYVIATYNSLVGTTFAATTNLPPRYSLNYSYNNGTAIAAISQNRAPVATADSAVAHAPVFIPVVANDSDADGDPLFVSAVTQGVHGTVTITGSQSITYSPGSSFGTANGDSFTYTVADGFGGVSIGTVSITKANQAPVAQNDIAISSGSALTIAVLANDTDADGDSLRVTGVTQGASGSVTFTAGSVTYTPGRLLIDHFSYTVADGFGGTASATITVKSGVPVAKNFAEASLRGGGSPVAGEPIGTTLAKVGVPAISDSGEIAFWALLRTGSGFFKALITGSDGRVLVRQTDLAPDAMGNPTTGVLFASFADPVINREGKVAFIATLSGKQVSSSSRTALYTNAFGPLSEAARTGSPAPGIDGARFRNIDSVLLSDATEGEGTLFFTGRLVTGAGGVTAWNNSVLCCVNGTDSSVLLREGSSLLVDGAPIQLKRFVTLGVVRGSPGQGRFSHQDSVVVQAYFTNGVEAVLRLAPNQAPEIVAAKGDALPAAPAGTSVASFGAPTLTGSGYVGGRVRLFKDSRLIPANRFDAILIGGTSEDYGQLLAQQSDPAPGVTTTRLPSATLRKLNEPVINSQGYAAFTGAITGYGVRNTTNTGLWWGKPGSLRLIARTGDLAPGTNGRFVSFPSMVLPDDTSEDGMIGPVFVASLSRGYSGLWAVDSSGTLQLVVRKGSLKEVNGVRKVISNITVLPPVAGSPGQARSYNRKRELVYRLTFGDGSQEIVKAIIP